MGLFRSKEQKANIADARAVYAGIATDGSLADPAAVHQLADSMRANAHLQALSDKERRTLGDAAFERYAEVVLADDILSEAEEDALTDLADALGVDQEALRTRHKPVLNRLVVARVNDDRLPVIDEPVLMVKKDEVVHLETQAVLLKEVAQREYRGGYSGVSFRVAKGVRFHTGGFRGHSVVVGTKLQPADSGVLSVSSRRAVFLGANTTIEFAYPKLVNLEVFNDGIRFHVSNRQTAHLFRLESGEVVAATINAAMQRLDA